MDEKKKAALESFLNGKSGGGYELIFENSTKYEHTVRNPISDKFDVDSSGLQIRRGLGCGHFDVWNTDVRVPYTAVVIRNKLNGQKESLSDFITELAAKDSKDYSGLVGKIQELDDYFHGRLPYGPSIITGASYAAKRSGNSISPEAQADTPRAATAK